MFGKFRVYLIKTVVSTAIQKFLIAKGPIYIFANENETGFVRSLKNQMLLLIS